MSSSLPPRTGMSRVKVNLVCVIQTVLNGNGPRNLNVALEWSHEIKENVVGDIASHCLSGDLVKREMNPAIDTASLFFVRHRRKARVKACRAPHALPSMLKGNVVAPEKQRERG